MDHAGTCCRKGSLQADHLTESEDEVRTCCQKVGLQADHVPEPNGEPSGTERVPAELARAPGQNFSSVGHDVSIRIRTLRTAVGEAAPRSGFQRARRLWFHSLPYSRGALQVRAPCARIERSRCGQFNGGHLEDTVTVRSDRVEPGRQPA